MAKSRFSNNIATKVVVSVALAINEVLNLIESRFAIGTYLLVVGESFGVEAEGLKNPYRAMRCFTFDENGMPDAEDIVALSVFSYSHYGEKDKDNPLVCGTKMSKRGHLVPNAELFQSSIPVKLSLIKTGEKIEDRDKNTVDAVKVCARKLQLLKVVGYKYVLMAEYGDDGHVKTDDNGNVIFRTKRKTVFEVVDLPAKRGKLKALREAIDEEIRPVYFPESEEDSEE